jgi:hypothetical protein
VIHAIRIEGRRPPLEAMNFIAFCMQEFRQVRSILARDTGNQGFRHVIPFDSRQRLYEHFSIRLRTSSRQTVNYVRKAEVPASLDKSQ